MLVWDDIVDDNVDNDFDKIDVDSMIEEDKFVFFDVFVVVVVEEDKLCGCEEDSVDWNESVDSTLFVNDCVVNSINDDDDFVNGDAVVVNSINEDDVVGNIMVVVVDDDDVDPVVIESIHPGLTISRSSQSLQESWQSKSKQLV